MVREWVEVVLGAAAGRAVIWLCVTGNANWAACGLLLFLCLTLLRKTTVLGSLVELVKALRAGSKPTP